MWFIKILQEVRIPILDTLFSSVTRLGEEAALLLAVFLFLWCINKRCGHYLCTLGVAAISSNLFLKIIFRIPRPWVLDPSFEIVESARAGATGYSFPSGHTQTSVALYGGIAKMYKNKAIRWGGILVSCLIAFSRMYLGVHTLQDVAVGAVLSVILIFLFHFLAGRETATVRYINFTYASLLVFCIIYIVFLKFYGFPGGVDAAELSESFENGWKMLGIIPSLWLAYILDEKYIHYETSCVWWGQVIKLVFGFAITVLLKEMLKEPLLELLGGSLVAGMLRYFIMGIFAGCIWPLTFRIYPKKKKEKNVEIA